MIPFPLNRLFFKTDVNQLFHFFKPIFVSVHENVLYDTLSLSLSEYVWIFRGTLSEMTGRLHRHFSKQTLHSNNHSDVTRRDNRDLLG